MNCNDVGHRWVAVGFHYECSRCYLPAHSLAHARWISEQLRKR